MRLTYKTTLFFLLAMVPIIMGGGLYFYFYFEKALRHDVKEEIVFDKMHWQDFLKRQKKDSPSFTLYSPEIIIYKTQKPLELSPSIKDTLIFQEYEHENDLYSQLSQVVPVNQDHYFILIRKSLLPKNKLVKHISQIMGLVLFTVFLVTLVLNWVINKRMWGPFYRTIVNLKNLNLHILNPVHYEKSSIKEFNDLNQSLELMTHQIQKDFKTLKEFTEDAAHEMQTPLSIAQNKLEILIQDPELKENQVQTIIQTSEALNRLNRLNSSLLLMAKIDNSQFTADKPISASPILDKYLLLFQEFILDKSIQVQKSIKEDFWIIINPLLADTLISNLLGNAIKYSIKGGIINIESEKDRLLIRNQSEEGEIEPNRIFKRFNRMDKPNSLNSNGLGLSIIKKITDNHQLQLIYYYEAGFHEFKILK